MVPLPRWCGPPADSSSPRPCPRKPTQVRGREDALREALVAADAEGSGRLEEPQMEAAFGAAGLKFTRHQLIALRRRVDREHSGGVAAEEILQLVGMS